MTRTKIRFHLASFFNANAKKPMTNAMPTRPSQRFLFNGRNKAVNENTKMPNGNSTHAAPRAVMTTPATRARMVSGFGPGVVPHRRRPCLRKGLMVNPDPRCQGGNTQARGRPKNAKKVDESRSTREIHVRHHEGRVGLALDVAGDGHDHGDPGQDRQPSKQEGRRPTPLRRDIEDSPARCSSWLNGVEQLSDERASTAGWPQLRAPTAEARSAAVNRRSRTGLPPVPTSSDMAKWCRNCVTRCPRLPDPPASEASGDSDSARKHA